MSVPSVRTVVVFPAPLGPRKPKTSPRPISKETSSNATRSPKRFVRWRTDSALPGLPPVIVDRTVSATLSAAR